MAGHTHYNHPLQVGYLYLTDEVTGNLHLTHASTIAAGVKMEQVCGRTD